MNGRSALAMLPACLALAACGGETPIEPLLSGPATELHLVTSPSAIATVGLSLTVQPVVQLVDANGRGVATAGIPITVEASGPCVEVRNATAMTDADGRATFNGLALRGAALPRVLGFSAPGLGGTASDSIALRWGSASATDTVSARCFGATGDGIVDDAPAIQRAVDSFGDVGGVLHLPAGTYALGSAHGSTGHFPDGRPIESAVLVRAPGTLIFGDGRGNTVLKLMPNRKLRMITTNASDIEIRDLTADGNRSNRDDATGWPSGDVVDALLYAATTDITQRNRRVVFRRVEVHNGIEDGVGFWQVDDGVVEDSHFHDLGTPISGGAGIAMHGHNGRIHGNISEDNSIGIWVAFGSSGTVISDNALLRNLDPGIQVGGLVAHFGAGDNRDITIRNNILRGNGGSGYGALVVSAVVGGLIEGNEVVDNHGDGVVLEDGRRGDAGNATSTGWRIEGNLVANTDQRRSQRNGIVILGQSEAYLLQNIVRDNGVWIGNQVFVWPEARINADWQQVNTITYTAPETGSPGG